MAPRYTAFPFPRPLFEKFVQENNGEQQRGCTTRQASGFALHDHPGTVQLAAWLQATFQSRSRHCQRAPARMFVCQCIRSVPHSIVHMLRACIQGQCLQPT
jgi:hypothetical protein